MPRPRRSLLTAACVASPLLAFAGLVYVEGTIARASLIEPEPVGVTLAPAPSHPPRPAATLPAAAPARADAAPEADAPSEPAVAAAHTAPDLTGLRLTLARRRARELGLKVIARDEYGDRVGPEVAQHYRVRKQLTTPGSELAPGAPVEVRVRAIGEAAEGY